MNEVDNARFFMTHGYLKQPKILQMEITNVCPLKCPQCYKKEHPIHADFNMLCKKLDEAKSFGVRSIMINGGEPLTHPDFLKIIDYISNVLEIDVYCFLSGFRITKEIAEALRNDRVYVTFSLNGSTNEINSLSRDGFELSINAINIFKEKGIRCGINWVERADNVFDFPNIVKFAEENEVSWVNIISNKISNGKINSPMSSEDYIYLADFVNSYQGKIEIRIEGCNNILRYFMGNTKMGIAHNGCQAGRLVYFIDVDGNYMPCSHLFYPEEFQSAKEYWEQSEVLQRLRDSNKIEKCKECIYGKQCKFCKAASLNTHEDFYENYLDCPMRKTMNRSK